MAQEIELFSGKEVCRSWREGESAAIRYRQQTRPTGVFDVERSMGSSVVVCVAFSVKKVP